MNLSLTLLASMRARLQSFAVKTAPQHTGSAGAAVALAIVDEGTGADLSGIAQPKGWSEQAALILTKRAKHLKNHPGQWALPGGRIDTGESPEQAACRELAEEVDLHLPPEACLGRLDDYVTRSGFVITPVVFWAGAARELRPNPGEVDRIHRIPLQEFLRADAPQFEHTEHSPHPILRMPVGDSWIAAPTAACIYQLREVALLGRDTRVAHFDQPQFAWR